MADVPAGFEVVKTASGAPPGFEVVKPAASASASPSESQSSSAAPEENEPKKAFGSLFDSPDQKPGTVSTPNYLVDQAARAPFKAFDFFHKLNASVPFEKWPEDLQKQYLKENGGKAPTPEVQWGAKIAEKLLGKEPEPSGIMQGIAGAGVSAAATGGAGEAPALAKAASMAKSGAFGAGQESITKGLTALGVPEEYADKIALAVTFGGGVAASKLGAASQQAKAEKAAVDKTKDYVANRESVEQTAGGTGTPKDTQTALNVDQGRKQAGLTALDTAAETAKKAADLHVEKTVAQFQPNTQFGDIAQGKLTELQDSVRQKAKAAAQGTLQNVFDAPRVDATDAIKLARKYEKQFAGRETVADSAGGVAANILQQTKENLGKTAGPVGSGKISSTMKGGKVTDDTATLDGQTAHNIIGDINDRIEGKGKYATEKTPDVGNLLEIKKSLIAAIDKSSNGAYTKYLGDYANNMAKLDPFQRGLAADKVTADLDYGRSKKMGPGEAAETLLPKGAKGGDVATRIQSLMGQDPEFQSSLKSYVGQRLSDLKASPGGLTPQKFAQFQKDYGPALKSYGIDKSLTSVQDAVQAAGAREAELTATRKATQNQRQQYESSALAKAAGVSDSSMVLDPIMQGDRSARLSNMRQAVQAIQKSPQSAAAMNGMRTKFNQYFFDHPEHSEELAFIAQKSGLYTPEQAQNIRKVADSVRGENAQQQARRMVKGSMPEADNKLATAAYIVHKVGFILMSGGVVAVAAGHPLGGIATGAAALAGQRLIERQKQMTVDAIAKIIEDPKMAKLMAEKTNKSNASMADHIARQIAADVVRQNSSEQQEQQQ